MTRANNKTKIRSSNGRVYPELVNATTANEKEATYYTALQLVAEIDEALTRGTHHYRNKSLARMAWITSSSVVSNSPALLR